LYFVIASSSLLLLSSQLQLYIPDNKPRSKYKANNVVDTLPLFDTNSRRSRELVKGVSDCVFLLHRRVFYQHLFSNVCLFVPLFSRCRSDACAVLPEATLSDQSGLRCRRPRRFGRLRQDEEVTNCPVQYPESLLLNECLVCCFNA
jgi:hypothetical protein